MALAAGDVTQLLADVQNGRPGAAPQLMPLVYEELRRLARRQMRRNDQTIRCRRLRWSTRRTFVWSISPREPGRTGRTSFASQRR
jgi:ECF sigma factor